MKKNVYTRPTITKVNLDSEINLIMSSNIPPLDPGTQMEMQNAMDDNGEVYNFFNPLNWFK